MTGCRHGARQDWSAAPRLETLRVPTVPGAMPKPCAAHDSPKAGLAAGPGSAQRLPCWQSPVSLPFAVVSVGVVRAPLRPQRALPPNRSCPKGQRRGQRHPSPSPQPCQGLLPLSPRGAMPGTACPWVVVRRARAVRVAGWGLAWVACRRGGRASSVPVGTADACRDARAESQPCCGGVWRGGQVPAEGLCARRWGVGAHPAGVQPPRG